MAESSSRAGSASDRDDVKREVDRLKEDFSQLRDDIAQLTRVMTRAGKSSVADARDRMQTKVTDTANATADRGRDALVTLEDEVRYRPFTSVGLAFLSGIFVGAILSGRR